MAAIRRPVPLGGKPGGKIVINDACHWLGIMGASVRQAHHDRPLSAADLELLRAVPAGACLPRLRPDTSAPVRNLPEAVVATGGMRAARRLAG
jgi:hypothetical protein